MSFNKKRTSKVFRPYFLVLLLILVVGMTPLISAYTFSRFPWYPWIPASPAPSTPTTPTEPPITPTPDPVPPTSSTLTPIKLSTQEESSLSLINRDRAKVGAAPLKADPYLNALARKRAEQMLSTNTISHVIPTLGSPWTSLTQYNIAYKSASENLQYGARSPIEAHTYLMNSHSHKTNILRRDFNYVGIAILPNGKGGQLQVQLFVGK